MEGIILVNKPKGISSFDVIRKLKKILKTKKIGHTGTLDPLATGLMLICVGKATKLASDLEAKNKVYLAYDSDLPGVNATIRAMEIMKKHGIKVKIIDMTPCKDPDEFLTTFGKESFEKRIQNALSEEEWKLKQIYLGNLNI